MTRRRRDSRDGVRPRRGDSRRLDRSSPYQGRSCQNRSRSASSGLFAWLTAAAPAGRRPRERQPPSQHALVTRERDPDQHAQLGDQAGAAGRQHQRVEHDAGRQRRRDGILWPSWTSAPVERERRRPPSRPAAPPPGTWRRCSGTGTVRSRAARPSSRSLPVEGAQQGRELAAADLERHQQRRDGGAEARPAVTRADAARESRRSRRRQEERDAAQAAQRELDRRARVTGARTSPESDQHQRPGRDRAM